MLMFGAKFSKMPPLLTLQISTLDTCTDILRPNMSCIYFVYFVGTNSLNKALFEVFYYTMYVSPEP